MGARKVRPGTTKVTGLTPDQVRVLRDADEGRQLVGTGHVALTPTTATFSCGAATAAEAVRVAIMTRKSGKLETRPLYAVERKLMKQVRPGDKAQPVTPDPPKASKRLKPSACDHDQREGIQQLGGTRVKCLCCGLAFDMRPDALAVRSRRAARGGPFPPQPARPGRGGVTTATVTQDGASPSRPQTAPQDRYAVIRDMDRWLVVDLPKKGVAHYGVVLCECRAEGPATKIAAALNARFPGEASA